MREGRKDKEEMKEKRDQNMRTCGKDEKDTV
jgi:hypothetical protein